MTENTIIQEEEHFDSNSFINQFSSFLGIRFEGNPIPYSELQTYSNIPLVDEYLGKIGTILFGNLPIGKALFIKENDKQFLEIIELEHNEISNLLNAQVDVGVEFGKASLSIDNVKDLRAGSVIKLKPFTNEILTLFLEDIPFAKGETVCIGDSFGIRLTSMISIPTEISLSDEAILPNPHIACRIVLGSTKISLKEIANLKAGSTVKLDKKVIEPIQLSFDNQEILNGEVVILDDYLGIRLISIDLYKPLLQNTNEETSNITKEPGPVPAITIEEYREFAKTNLERFVEITKAILHNDKSIPIGILILALPEEIATSVLQQLQTVETEQILFSISKLDIVSKSDIQDALKRFSSIIASFAFVGGVERARIIAEKAIGAERAAEVMEQLALAPKDGLPFEFIRRTDPAQLLNFIQSEHPQTIALVLSYLDIYKAAAILSALPNSLQSDVAERIATIDRISPEVLKEVEQVLERKLSALASEDYASAGGIDSIVEILNNTDRGTEKTVIEALEERNPELAEEIKKRMFVFEDIVLLDDRAIQKVMREVDNTDLAKALKSVDVEVQEKIFKNMSKRAGQLLREDMDFMGPVRLRDVEDSQQKIVNVIRKLEECGEIVVARSGEDELVV